MQKIGKMHVLAFAASIFFLFASINVAAMGGNEKEESKEKSQETKTEQGADSGETSPEKNSSESTDNKKESAESPGGIGADNAVASVNGAFISKSDYEQQVNQYMNQMKQQQQGQPIQQNQVDNIKKQVLDAMIGRELLYQQAQKLGFEASDEEVQKRMSQVESQFGGKEQYEKALSDRGYTRDSIKQQMIRQIIIEKLVNQEVYGNIEIAEKEMKDFYDKNTSYFNKGPQIKARHILIELGKDAGEAEEKEARSTLDEVQTKLENGEKFADLAKEYSEGPSAEKGGDLGFFQKGQMVEPFDKVAFNLEPGEVSDIVKTQFGLHLIKVEDTKESSSKSYTEVKEQIRQYLRSQETSTEVEKYVEKLKEDANIEKMVEN